MLTRKIHLRIYLLTNFTVFSVLFGISIQHASFGKEFLLTAPSVFKNTTEETVNSSAITFFMVTLAANGTQISITIPEFEHTNHSLNHTVNLKARETLSFSPDDEFKYVNDISKIWCFRFTGNEAFSITVSVRLRSGAFSTFQAVPTEWWGKKYLVFTLNGKPFIQVISNADNNVVTMYLNLRSVLLDPNVQLGSESHTDSLKFNNTLDKWEAITLSNCVTRSTLSGMKTFVGSVIVGQSPIGVISGNCNGSTFTYSCKPDSRRRLAGNTTDIATEMLLPVAAHGKEFVVVHISRKIPSAAVIMASKEDTKVNISTSTGVLPVTVLNTTRWSYSFEVTENRKVVSSRRVQVVVMSLSTCLGSGASSGDEGGPAISLILPNSFFYSEFFWSPPEELGSHYATVVMTLDHIKHVHVNDAPLRHYDVENVVGYPNYQVSTFSLPAKHNHITTPSQFIFACYVYGMGPTVQYMHPAGFEGCEDTVDAMFPGDLIDNDCDGKVGEEIRNGIDDDGDGRIDEDILHSKDEDGMWGEWQPWTCNPNCSRPVLMRTRLCDSPPPSGRGHDCDGEPLITKNVRCKPGIYCPRRCASFAWGSQCERSCANCGKDCDTETGLCDSCKSGYKHRESGCEQACEVNEYGVDCAFICTEKCNADCADRVTGECPKVNRFLIVFMFALVALLGLLMLSIRRRTPRMTTITVHHEGSFDRQRNVVIHHIKRKESRYKKTGRTGAIVIPPNPP